MTFSITWNLAFEATPAAGDDASEGATRFQELKLAIRERLAIDHSLAGDANDGAHKKVTLLEQSGDPTLAANTGFFYTKDVSGVTEVFYMDSNGAVTQITKGGSINVSGFLSGQIIDFGGTSVPSGWLECDGSSLLRASYPALFSAIGTTWGSTDGTHFNIPNLQRYTTIGRGGVAVNGPANTVGSRGGAEAQDTASHTLTASESGLPAHTHIQNPPVNNGPSPVGVLSPGSTYSNSAGSTGNITGGAQNAAAGHVHSASNVMQPSAVVLKIIKI